MLRSEMRWEMCVSASEIASTAFSNPKIVLTPSARAFGEKIKKEKEKEKAAASAVSHLRPPAYNADVLVKKIVKRKQF
jgi:hypothetical protein